MNDRYVRQVHLLVSTLQDIANETVFALKGGTAINLFYRDMPRLSVDIDLAYLPVADRLSSLKEIDNARGTYCYSCDPPEPEFQGAPCRGRRKR